MLSILFTEILVDLGPAPFDSWHTYAFNSLYRDSYRDGGKIPLSEWERTFNSLYRDSETVKQDRGKARLAERLSILFTEIRKRDESIEERA